MMDEKEVKAYRLSHLSILLAQTFQTIAHDSISQQMEKHVISSKYTEDRLIEVFQTLLNKEREELLLQTELQIQSLKDENLKIRNDFKAQLREKGFNIQSICATNLEMRARVGEANALLFGRKWKRNQLQKSEKMKIDRLQQQINKYKQYVTKIKGNVHDFKNELDHLYSDISDMICQYPKTFRHAKRKMEAKFSEQLNIDTHDLPSLEEKYKAAKIAKKENFESMRFLYQYVTKQEPSMFSIAEITEFKNHIQDFQKDDYSEGNKEITRKIKEKIQSTIGKQESEYMPILTKQRKALEKLKSELEATCKKLQTLMSSESAIDRRFLSMVEASKNEMVNTQAKTDDIMLKLQKLSFSSSSNVY
ncbi:hypothetical protein TRFO_22545 [Tritrichomonas foetus]|uniref:Uncharacterized protein n=1 Tax=Tritrichomonas foetus TaxID=1144522 RepID=A0A1J4KBL6_9EUKA|nr:hypothetical protein TRFO_22545 [Tritrichomonas foetus]|eukprot:OHT08799.1 hypothetical protein TRFO_22545 [Tritrichomonas foetus]